MVRYKKENEKMRADLEALSLNYGTASNRITDLAILCKQKAKREEHLEKENNDLKE